ncbi:tetratricopeptide repeat protein [Bacteroides sp. BFG-257]|uniref:tetratricopeptide repeat protein n=1 Tax=Bacteroides TaxID=816 RepID=UPI001CCF10B6|nr:MULTISPECIES: tetratricopeptide repeat protein [Bacteroides]UBD70078.1 tetratricopeptide repeat protein [Bacteroides cellulosilyticus]UVO98705.1 tetratricopeptide repeat protein [Bacteroides sp. BFG-257]
MSNLRILLYVFILSLVACHPEGTNVKQGLDKAAQLIEQDPDTASIILETIQMNQMNEEQLAEYNLLCTQFNEDKNIPHSSDNQIRQAVSYYEQYGNELQKSKAYYYLACVESDLNHEKDAEVHFKEAIKLAAQAEEYEQMTKICKRCSLYYQKYENFDEALEMERKAYASQLMLIDSKDNSTIILSSALGLLGVMSLLLGLLWKKHLSVHSQLDTFKEEMQMKEIESDKLVMQCNYLEEKYQSLQQHIYESSPVVSKVRQLKERTALSSKISFFSEKDWTELLRLQESVYGLVSKLRGISPKLTEEDLRVCAFLREGVQPACFADLMKLTVETLTRRISRIKTEKLMLANSKESLEDIVKSL